MLVGGGIPFFPQRERQVGLELVENCTFSSGVVYLHYRVRASPLVGQGTSEGPDMAWISYDEQTAAAFKAVREVPRDFLSECRESVRRHLRPSPGMTLADIGAGTGAFSAAFSGWFGLSVLSV